MSTLSLRTLNRTYGIREISVDPESNISVLRKFEGQNCIFIYKKTILIESMTFNYYSMEDGDIICSVIPAQLNIPKGMKDPKLLLDLEREKLKLMDRKFNRIDGNPTIYKKFQNMKLKASINPISHDSELATEYKPLQKPSTQPLPAFWIQ
ncbi:ubiquitin-like family [Trichomonas vaginalis G3]|uniref:ubiquitin-like family n=1 Tax=Trichomonas vaginalis (strain ATCC PRA-98 / G3) TaxID=412133 RepID=UPI0021E57A64|nr:ubiquitin-like family [Trichomonas vaginalis G3]KAI5508185.1 ubiquitin-like family [Trichomonas vaginalis G3]